MVAIGAFRNAGNGTDSGHVRVYQTDGTTCTQVGADIAGAATGYRSGYSVSLSSDGTVVAIGAHGNDGNGVDSGHVRVYYPDDTLWPLRTAEHSGVAAGST